MTTKSPAKATVKAKTPRRRYRKPIEKLDPRTVLPDFPYLELEVWEHAWKQVLAQGIADQIELELPKDSPAEKRGRGRYPRDVRAHRAAELTRDNYEFLTGQKFGCSADGLYIRSLQLLLDKIGSKRKAISIVLPQQYPTLYPQKRPRKKRAKKSVASRNNLARRIT